MSLVMASAVGMAVWFGGFTFYGGFIQPRLHNRYDSFEAGLVTREVTVDLNWIGAGVLALWWVLAWVERGSLGKPARLCAFGMLGFETACLAALFVLHGVLDRMIDSGTLKSFRSLHEVYLIISTAGWGVNLALLALGLAACAGMVGPRSQAHSA